MICSKVTAIKVVVIISNRWGVAALLRYFHKSSLNQSVNDEAVCKTAPATPGLLIISEHFEYQYVQSKNIYILGFL